MTTTTPAPKGVSPAQPAATLALATMAAPAFDFSPEQRQLLQNTLAKNSTPDEFALYLQLARTYGLDPFAKEIWCVKLKAGDPALIMTSRDGYLKVAQRDPNFVGLNAAVVRDGDHFEFEPATGQVVHKFGAKRGAILGAWAIAKHAKREPVARFVDFNEYKKGHGAWATYPSAMIEKCFDEQTEVLTERGFQRFADVTGRVLQVTPTGLEPTDARPFVQAYTGEMVTHVGDQLDFCVTPNHDMVTTTGKIEAGAMYAAARVRPRHFIPRSVVGTKADAPFSDAVLQLWAAYLADGYASPSRRFTVAVSRPRKLAALRAIALHVDERPLAAAGAAVVTATRTIVTHHDKQMFAYEKETLGELFREDKSINVSALLSLSRRQAKVFADAWIAFDGHVNKAGVQRLYTSRPDHLAAFEVAAVAAGYAVNKAVERTSDISTRPNFAITLSSRDAVGVRRWGRAYHNLDKGSYLGRTGLTMTPNASGRVWCVTVPSGVIVVRRNGFSMLCGNCAEVIVLKRQFGINGLVTHEEMGTGAIDVEVIRDDLVREADRVVDRSTGEVVRQAYEVLGPEPSGDGAQRAWEVEQREAASALPPRPPSRQDQVKVELKVAGLDRAAYDAILAEQFPGQVLGGLTDPDFVKLLEAIKARRVK